MDIPGGSQNLPFDPDQILPDEQCNSEEVASEEVIYETFELYIFHLSRRIVDKGLKNPLDSLASREFSVSRNAVALNKLTNKFIIPPLQRIKVYEQAQEVDLMALNVNIFEQLVNGIFEDGDDEVPWKRVLAVFYFCSDLSIKALEEKAVGRFINIYNWTSFYLGVKFALWVEKEGGWPVILKQDSTSYATGLSILGLCCIGVLAFCIYIRRK